MTEDELKKMDSKDLFELRFSVYDTARMTGDYDLLHRIDAELRQRAKEGMHD